MGRLTATVLFYIFSLCEALKFRNNDGPTKTILNYMKRYNFNAPSDWKNFRPLTSKWLLSYYLLTIINIVVYHSITQVLFLFLTAQVIVWSHCFHFLLLFYFRLFHFKPLLLMIKTIPQCYFSLVEAFPLREHLVALFLQQVSLRSLLANLFSYLSDLFQLKHVKLNSIQLLWARHLLMSLLT